MPVWGGGRVTDGIDTQRKPLSTDSKRGVNYLLFFYWFYLK